MNYLAHEHRILVVADRTCPCPAVTDEVARRAIGTPHDVLVVAPALNSRLSHLTSDIDEAVRSARERVEAAVAELHERGINARGAVGDANPIVAVDDALAEFAATEIVIATHPAGRSHWLERGLVAKVEARFDGPVTHLVSSYGLAGEPVAA